MERELAIVQIIMLAFALIYFLLEIYLNVNSAEGDTSNIILFRWTRKVRLLFIPYAIGAIGGHLFLGTRNDFFQFSNGIMPVVILGVSAVILLIIGRVMLRKDKDVSKPLITLLLIAGFAYGHLIWSMNYVCKDCIDVQSDCNPCHSLTDCNIDCHD